MSLKSLIFTSNYAPPAPTLQFLHMSGEMNSVLALIEGLPATALTTQVICVWFLDQGGAGEACDGWPVSRRDASQNHAMYNGAIAARASEQASGRAA